MSHILNFKIGQIYNIYNNRSSQQQQETLVGDGEDLDLVYNGQPYIRAGASPALQAKKLSIVYNGQPYVF